MVHKQQLHTGYLGRITAVLIAVLLTGIVGYIGVRDNTASRAAVPGQIAVSPASASWTQGTNVSVSIRENSGTDAINAVQFVLNYDPAQLQYVSFTESGEFTFVAPSAPTCTPGSASCATSAGLIRIMRGMKAGEAGVTGEHGIVTLNFKVLASSGTAALTINPYPDSNMSGGDGVNKLTSVANGSFSISPALVTDASLSLVPANGNYAAGATIPVVVRLNSPTQKVYSVHAVLLYPAAQLQYVGTAPSSAFPSETATTNSAGTVDLTRGIGFGAQGVSGSADVATVNFKVIGSSGSAGVSIRRASGAVDSGTYDSNGKNLLGSVANATYTIPAATGGGSTGSTGNTSGTGGTSTTPPPSAPPGNGSSSSSSGSTPTVYSGKTSFNTASGGHVSLNGDSAQVDGSVALAPVADPSVLEKNPTDSIKKVEYWLNGKLLSTQSKSPYTYTFDTKKLRNGSYELVIKTYYASGTATSSKQKVQVNNDVNFAYVMAHYGIGIVATLLGLGIAVFLFWLYVWPHFSKKPAAAFVYDTEGGVVRPEIAPVPNQYEAPNPSVVTPSNVTPETTVLDPGQTAAAESTVPIAIENPQTVTPAAQPSSTPSPNATTALPPVQAETTPPPQTTLKPTTPPAGQPGMLKTPPAGE